MQMHQLISRPAILADALLLSWGIVPSSLAPRS
jgi:hypothetical protein